MGVETKSLRLQLEEANQKEWDLQVKRLQFKKAFYDLYTDLVNLTSAWERNDEVIRELEDELIEVRQLIGILENNLANEKEENQR